MGTSSGNAGAASAAYAAQAGLPSVLFVLEHADPQKLALITVFQGRAYAVEGFGHSPVTQDYVLSAVTVLAQQSNWELMITTQTYNPQAMEGVKTIAYEVCDALAGTQPGSVFVPVGGGGLFVASAKGFDEYVELGLLPRLPVLFAVQPAGCATLVHAWRQGNEDVQPVEPKTRISGLQLSRPLETPGIFRFLRGSGGQPVAVSDELIFEAQRLLASAEGILAEPAGATALAGLIAHIEDGGRPPQPVICYVTGSGLKSLPFGPAPQLKVVKPEEITAALLAGSYPNSL